MCLSDLRDEDSGVLTAVGEDVHAVNVSGPSLPMPAPVRDPRCLFAEIALHAKLVQLRFCRFHLCEVAPRQHDHGRFSEFLTDRLFPCRRDRLSRL